MLDKIDDIESTLEIFIISDSEYILKRSYKNNPEFYYCIIGKDNDFKKGNDFEKDNAPDKKPVITIRGKISDNGTLTFNRDKINIEINNNDLCKYQYRKLV